MKNKIAKVYLTTLFLGLLGVIACAIIRAIWASPERGLWAGFVGFVIVTAWAFYEVGENL